MVLHRDRQPHEVGLVKGRTVRVKGRWGGHRDGRKRLGRASARERGVVSGVEGVRKGTSRGVVRCQGRVW